MSSYDEFGMFLNDSEEGEEMEEVEEQVESPGQEQDKPEDNLSATNTPEEEVSQSTGL